MIYNNSEGHMYSYIKERATFIVVAIVLLIGFMVIVGQSSGSTKSEATVLPTTVSTSQPMTRGNNDAKVSLIQYSDFLCPSCSYLTTQIMPTIETDYIQTGKVKFEFRPMAFIAQGSTTAGEGAYCAIDQNKFWDYHDAIYNYVWATAFSKGVDPKSTTILTTPIIESISAQAGLDTTAFTNCLESGDKKSAIAQATNTANSYGITSTPYLLVNGHKIGGNLSLETVKALIDSQL